MNNTNHRVPPLVGGSGALFRDCLTVCLFFWAVFVLTNSGFDTSEGVYQYRMADQIVRTGQLSFRDPQPGQFVVAPNGRTYAVHEIGNTLFLLPTAILIRLVKHAVREIVSPILLNRIEPFALRGEGGMYSAGAAPLFFAILRRHYGQGTRQSFLATCTLMFSTYLWTYSRNLFDGVLCATLLLASWFFLLEYAQTNERRHLVCAVLFLGVGFITRITMLLAIVASFLYLAGVARAMPAHRWRVNYTVAMVTLLPFVVWQSWYNHLRTGIFYLSPVQTARFTPNNALDGRLVEGLAGLLCSPGKSLWVYVPLLAISVLMFKRFSREHKAEALYVASLSILWLLVHAKLRSWYGSWGWGPRHFVTIIPIALLPCAIYGKSVMKHTALKIVASVLGAWGILLAAASIISNWHFRMSYALQQGRLNNTAFVWGVWQNQAIDMLQASTMNVVRLVHHAPMVHVIGASPENEYASNTLNLWWYSALHVGVPWWLVLMPGLGWLALAGWALHRLLRDG